MTSRDQLKSELRTVVAAARQIGEHAKAAGREQFTPDEQSALGVLITRGYQLKEEIAAEKPGGTDWRAGQKRAVDEFVNKLGEAGHYAARGIPNRLAALGGTGDWARGVMDQAVTTASGQKALLTTGQAYVSVPMRAEPVRLTEPVLGLRQVLNVVPNTTGQYQFMRQQTRTNNAAAVAVGALKPTSPLELVPDQGTVTTLATLSEPIARQWLRDAPYLDRFLDRELRLMVEQTLEAQIIAGSGSGANLRGFANTSGVQVHAYATDVVRTIRGAITKLESNNLQASALVLNPTDWEKVEIAASTFTNAETGAPIDRLARRIWGVPVVLSTALTAGTGYLLDSESVELHLREDVVIDWSENLWDPNALGAGVGANTFARNTVVFRAEMAVGLAVLRPLGIVRITGIV